MMSGWRLIPLLFTLLFCNIFGANGYSIKNYKIEIDVTEDNRYSVRESIRANFEIPKRGIIRAIPSRYGSRDIKLRNIEVSGAPYSAKTFSTGVNLK
ncbi:MAG: DUF2207 domain-containing protein, partial [Fusobacteriaceae bacterium]